MPAYSPSIPKETAEMSSPPLRRRFGHPEPTSSAALRSDATTQAA